MQRDQAQAREYEYASLVQLQGWSEVPRSIPLFESLVVFENYPVSQSGPDQVAAGLRLRDKRAADQTHYPLTLMAVPGRQLLLGLNYDERRFEPGAIERMLGHLGQVLEQVMADPGLPLSELELLTAAERGEW